MEFINSDYLNSDYDLTFSGTLLYLNSRGEAVINNMGKLWQVSGLFLTLSTITSNFILDFD